MRFRRLIKRGSRFIQKHELWSRKQDTGKSDALLLTERKHIRPLICLAEPIRKMAQLHKRQHFPQFCFFNFKRTRIAKRLSESAQWQIGLLGYEQHAGIFRPGELAFGKRPEPRKRTQQGAFTGSGYAGNQQCVAGGDFQINIFQQCFFCQADEQ